MKRALLLLIVAVMCGTHFLQAKPIPLTYEENSSTIPGGAKAPIRPWVIDVTDNVLTMSATPCAYTLVLCDEAGDVAYTAVLPAGTTMATLPATLSGDYEIRFVADTYFYYGYITL